MLIKKLVFLITTGVISTSVLGGCFTRVPNREDIAGVWFYDARGDGVVIEGEAYGYVEFKPNGDLYAKNVSGIVTGLAGSELYSGNGVWSVPEQSDGLFSRRIVHIQFINDISITTGYYESWGGVSTLTFSRDEESGEWVHYRKGVSVRD